MDDAQKIGSNVQVMPTPDQAQIPQQRPREAFSLVPQSLQEAQQLAEIMSCSEIVPKHFQEKPANIFVAVQMGQELGLSPMQSLRFIAVINGMPSVYGDGLIAICRAHPAFEWIEETLDDKTLTATCRVKRRNEPVCERAFSWADAERAQLTTKDGPWITYPRRMLQMRARGWALRDTFADAIAGVAVAEEAIDMPSVDYGHGTPQVTGRADDKPRGMDALSARVDEAHGAVEPDVREPTDAELADQFVERMQRCESFEELEAVGSELSRLQEGSQVRGMVRPHYRQIMETLLSRQTEAVDDDESAEDGSPAEAAGGSDQVDAGG